MNQAREYPKSLGGSSPSALTLHWMRLRKIKRVITFPNEEVSALDSAGRRLLAVHGAESIKITPMKELLQSLFSPSAHHHLQIRFSLPSSFSFAFSPLKATLFMSFSSASLGTNS